MMIDTGKTRLDMPVPEWVGWLFVAYGVAVMLVGAIKRRKLSSGERHMICPKFNQVCKAYEAPTGKCPHRDTPMEELQGYYERHPDEKRE
jgi:hypothetical protein